MKKICFTLFLNFLITCMESKINANFMNKFNTFESIDSYLRQLSEDYPDNVIVSSIGSTYNDLPIPVVKISSNIYDNEKKPVILIDAGIHAREWISTAVALNLIHLLVEEEQFEDMLQRVDWYIIPVMNPDGYIFSHEEDRLWRKNLRPGRICYGVDLNRNFNFHFGQEATNRSECSINYPGPSPFSEPETQAFRDFVSTNKDQIKLYISLHAYGQLVLYPYGVKDKDPSEAVEEKHHNLGKRVVKAINSVRNSNYRSGMQKEILYPASGLSMDWMAHAMKIPLNFIIEMSSKLDKFQPSVEEIQPTFEEIFEGIRVFHEYVEKKFVKLKSRRMFHGKRSKGSHKMHKRKGH